MIDLRQYIRQLILETTDPAFLENIQTQAEEQALRETFYFLLLEAGEDGGKASIQKISSMNSALLNRFGELGQTNLEPILQRLFSTSLDRKVSTRIAKSMKKPAIKLEKDIESLIRKFIKSLDSVKINKKAPVKSWRKKKMKDIPGLSSNLATSLGLASAIQAVKKVDDQ